MFTNVWMQKIYSHYKSIAMGKCAAFAIDSQGYGWSIGCNAYGQLGDGSGVDRTTWGRICGGHKYKSIHPTTQRSTVVAIKEDGTAMAWGDAYCGMLGNGSTDPNVWEPVPVCCNYTYCKIDVGSYLHVVGIKTDGKAVSWGYNTYGNLGDGSTTHRCQPVAVCCDYDYLDISAGRTHTVGIKTDGKAVSWGYGNAGRLGTGSTVNVCQPVAICCDYDYCKVSSGEAQTVAIKADGLAVAWGDGSWGALGNGNDANVCQPVSVCCDYCYSHVDAGIDYALAIKKDGLGVAWGYGTWGLGNGDGGSVCQPVPICGDHCYCIVSASACHSGGVRVDGIAFGWGANNCNTLGNGSATDRCVPTKMYCLPIW